MTLLDSRLRLMRASCPTLLSRNKGRHFNIFFRSLKEIIFQGVNKKKINPFRGQKSFFYYYVITLRQILNLKNQYSDRGDNQYRKVVLRKQVFRTCWVFSTFCLKKVDFFSGRGVEPPLIGDMFPKMLSIFLRSP